MTKTAAGRFPADPIFTQLLHVAREITHVVVSDPHNGVEADYAQLISDILQVQKDLLLSLPRSLFSATNFLEKERPYIFLLSDGSYEAIVAAFAILSIGGAVVPLATSVSPETALSLMQRCQSTTILAGEAQLQLGGILEKYTSSRSVQTTIIPIRSKTSPVIQLDIPLMNLNPDIDIPPDHPGMILFTSGTSGPPKGVVLPRRLFYEIHKTSRRGEVFLHHQPPTWISGALPIFRYPLAGARMEIIVNAPTPANIWDRLRGGTITDMVGHTRFWGSLMSYFQTNIAQLQPDDASSYIRSARVLKTARVVGTMPHSLLLKFWRKEIGAPLHVTYGATESGGRGLQTTSESDLTLDRCLGRPQPEVVVRLSNGDDGEIQIKNPVLFTHYLSDEVATRAVFTEDGYYRTGDLSHRVGEDFIFDGRMGDFIKSNGHRIPIVEVEMHLLRLPFIADACVLPVTDATSNERVAAIIRLQQDLRNMPHGVSFPKPDGPWLEFVRDQLSAALPTHMMPTALRVLHDVEDIPRTDSMKVLRRKAAEQYFALSAMLELPPDVEKCDVGY